MTKSMIFQIVKSANREWDYLVNLKIGNNKVKVPVEKKWDLGNMHLFQLQFLNEKNQDFILIA